MQKIKIAITGGIGSGKTTVLACLRELGYKVFSCDEIYKNISLSHEYMQSLGKVFPDVVNNKGIDRQKLSAIVFNDEEKRKRLNAIAHPLVMNTLLEEMDNCKASIVFAEVPLLFEGNFESLFDQILYIQRDRETRIEAVCNRDGLSSPEVVKRINTQFNPDEKAGKTRLQNCNAWVLQNVGTKEALKNKIKQFIAQL